MPQLERELPAMDMAPSGSPPPTGPCVMVIFGGTGDLTARKLFPALYNLVKSKLLSPDFAILGIGRNDYSREQYQKIMGDNLDKFATGTVDPKLRDWMMERVYYVGGEFQDPALYTRVGQRSPMSTRTATRRAITFFISPPARLFLATSSIIWARLIWHAKKTDTGGAWSLKSLLAMIWDRPKH